jgi:hypothetical protein
MIDSDTGEAGGGDGEAFQAGPLSGDLGQPAAGEFAVAVGVGVGLRVTTSSKPPRQSGVHTWQGYRAARFLLSDEILGSDSLSMIG